jgi:hypothetical protein
VNCTSGWIYALFATFEAMNLEFKQLLPDNFGSNSKVWVYQSNRLFTLSEALEIETQLNKFAAEWLSHGAEVKAYCNLFFGQFIVLMADERQTTVGGCSTDSSVRFIKEIGERFHVDFFNRTTLAFYSREKIELLPMNQLQYALDNGFITADTLYFNNLVSTKEALENNWIIPVKDSWLASRLKLQTNP